MNISIWDTHSATFEFQYVTFPALPAKFFVSCLPLNSLFWPNPFKSSESNEITESIKRRAKARCLTISISKCFPEKVVACFCCFFFVVLCLQSAYQAVTTTTKKKKNGMIAFWQQMGNGKLWHIVTTKTRSRVKVSRTGTHFPNRFLIIFAYHSVCSFLLSGFPPPPREKNNKEPP